MSETTQSTNAPASSEIGLLNRKWKSIRLPVRETCFRVETRRRSQSRRRPRGELAATR